jgi:hypothetical protein
MGETERKQFLSRVIAAPDGYAHKVLNPNVVVAHDLRIRPESRGKREMA